MVFDENPLEGDDTDLEATADGTAKVGTTTLTISGSDGRTTVRVRLRVKVTAGAPAALATVAPSTAVATTLPATTAAATTLAAPTSPATTLVATATTTPASTTLPTTTAPAAAVGDLIITRKVSQTIPCAPAVTGNAFVSISMSNPDSTPRVVSLVTPGSCNEVKLIELSPGAVGTTRSPIEVGAVLIVRSVNTAGSPIRRVLTVTAAGTLNVGSSANVVVKCSGAVLSNGQLVPLTDGQQFVFNNIPAGASCTITDQFDATPPKAFSDNVGLASDATVLVPGRPAACAIATITTPVPGAAGCYAEFVHLR